MSRSIIRKGRVIFVKWKSSVVLSFSVFVFAVCACLACSVPNIADRNRKAVVSGTEAESETGREDTVEVSASGAKEARGAQPGDHTNDEKDTGFQAGKDRSGDWSETEDVASDDRPEEEGAVSDLRQEPVTQPVESILSGMTLEEKVAQLFVITPEALTGVGTATAAGEATREAFFKYPVGGLVYFENNLVSPDQTKTMLSHVQAYSMERVGLPAFLCVDEEGGTVTRIGGTGKFDVPVVESMASIGQKNDRQAAREAGEQIGRYLHDLGFNVDFAPVADVLSNPENQIVKSRSFGEDAALVSDLCLAVCEGLREHGVIPVLKHYPGHGATEADSHKGCASTQKTLEELLSCELIPFQRGIDAGVSVLMAGHISLPNVTGDDTPASLSEMMITQVLRRQMGYDGLVITDALNMGAVTQQYSSAEAAVRVLQAGGDLILMPADFFSAYQGVLDAVRQGILTEGRIDASVRRILAVKVQMEK